MEGLLIILGGTSVFAAMFAIWLNTKWGERWLDQL